MDIKHELTRIHEAMTDIRKELGEARLGLTQKERNNENHPLNTAARKASAYGRHLQTVIDTLP